MWVWTDGNGKEVAVEDRSDHYKLKFTVSLHRGTIDALVALWCGRIWEYSDENATPLEGGLDRGTFSGVYFLTIANTFLVHRNFRLAKEIRPNSKTISGFYGF